MTNFQHLMQVGKQLKERIAKLQEELSNREISASSGEGMVTVTVDGRGSVSSIIIDPNVVNSDDVKVLQDFLMEAVTKAQGRARSQYEKDMKRATLGMPIQLPGLF